ncbi:ECF transporter S component [Mycoplasma sp. Ms02]|uniref:ECF transporter S component n=1 Tax=Mycoplasma sp. Ms02 TaxID=353851 RepID=UPI001C8A6F37|nr:ECF transporter S component [Mycoplasma sp. Ms02]QZE12187.1 ECF transporter S component [Mycoplasma sp. Ms02]
MKKRYLPKLPWAITWTIFPKWTIRKMVFVGIMIATCVVFTIVGTQIVPAASIPTIKYSFISLPVKITGLIFGPVIGFFVGAVSDILSMLFIPPSAYSPYYTLATGITGLVSGIVGWLFLTFIKFYFGGPYTINKYKVKILKLKKSYEAAILNNKEALAWKYKHKIIYYRNKILKIENSGTTLLSLNVNYFFSVVILSTVTLLLVYIIGFKASQEAFDNVPFKSRWLLLTLSSAGIVMMIVFLTISRFKMSPTKFLIICPIIILSAMLEIINVPILSIADNQSLASGKSSLLLTWIFSHVITSPLKMWFNLFVIYYSYRVISPLVYKNNDLGY